jgi:hypothetical protein
MLAYYRENWTNLRAKQPWFICRDCDHNGCTDRTECVETLYSGLDEVVQTTVVVYPNPSVNGSFNVKSDDIIKSIEVIDMLGRIINLPLNLSTDAVDGSRLESGKYIVRVTTEHAILMSEIVIVR